MKNPMITFMLLFICVFTFQSCKKDYLHRTEGLKVEDFEKTGEVHNGFMTNLLENFDVKEYDELASPRDKVDLLYAFNSDFLLKSGSIVNTGEYVEYFNRHKGLVITEKLTGSAFHVNRSGGRDEYEGKNVFELLNYLDSLNLVSEFWYSTLYDLCTDLKSNYVGALSDQELELKIEEYVQAFDSHGYDPSSGEGVSLGKILAITTASVEWWKAHPEAYSGFLEGERLAPWAAADIVGAAWGGATGAIGSYTAGGEVDWGAVGVGALSGAIAGSTGAVGKIAKWLF